MREQQSCYFNLSIPGLTSGSLLVIVRQPLGDSTQKLRVALLPACPPNPATTQLIYLMVTLFQKEKEEKLRSPEDHIVP